MKNSPEGKTIKVSPVLTSAKKCYNLFWTLSFFYKLMFLKFVGFLFLLILKNPKISGFLISAAVFVCELSSKHTVYYSNNNKIAPRMKSLYSPIFQTPLSIFFTTGSINLNFFRSNTPHKEIKLKNILIDVTENLKATTTLVFVHGFSANSKSRFIKEIVRHTYRKYRCVAINYRGCKQFPLLDTTFSHLGFTDDIKQALEYIREKYGDTKIILIGASLGGNLSSLCLGRDREIFNRFNIVGGVGISMPFDFNLLAKQRGFFIGLVNYFFKSILKTSFVGNKKVFDKEFVDRVRKTETIPEINLLIAKRLGYENLEEYYTLNSNGRYMKNIKVPFLVVNSKNDFIITEHFPKEEFFSNDNLIGVHTEKGSHIGYHDILFDFAIRDLIEEFCGIVG